ncbi:hypothetical protein AMECASPLE_037456 [Ameca splendens]|uniref:Uncharacterized protein n=1 Tax=Ameca splendens TaxID=208324 RepID=A0ABV0XKZ9_9TELE
MIIDHMHKACRSKLCSREFPAETLSLRSRVEQFPDLKGGQQHRITVVTAINVQCGQRTERAAQPLLRRCAGS